MPRPKPIVLHEQHNPLTHELDQILSAPAIYAITYRGVLVNVRRSQRAARQVTKYAATSYPTSGSAFRQRDRLNQQFETNEFGVVKLKGGKPVERKQP